MLMMLDEEDGLWSGNLSTRLWVSTRLAMLL